MAALCKVTERQFSRLLDTSKASNLVKRGCCFEKILKEMCNLEQRTTRIAILNIFKIKCLCSLNKFPFYNFKMQLVLGKYKIPFEKPCLYYEKVGCQKNITKAFVRS